MGVEMAWGLRGHACIGLDIEHPAQCPDRTKWSYERIVEGLGVWVLGMPFARIGRNWRFPERSNTLLPSVWDGE